MWKGWVVLCCVACGDKPVVEETGDTSASTTEVEGFSSLSVSVDACREASVRVAWTGQEGATSYVRYGTGGVVDRVTPSVVDTAEVSIMIRGLVNGETVTVQPVSELSDGSVLEAPAEELALASSY